MANGNTSTRKRQWRYRATRKQKINGSTKSSFINNQSKCKWMELTNEKTHSGEVVKNKIQVYAAPRRLISTLEMDTGSK